MKRFRISLRLMLLVVALVAVVLAWVGVGSKRQRAETQARIQELQRMRGFAVKRMASHPEEGATWRTSIGQIDEELEAKQGPVAPK